MRFPNAVVAVLASALLVVACGSAEDRATKYLTRAQASFDAEDYVKAELDIKNSLQIDPKNVEARYLMAQLAEKQQKWRLMYRSLMMVTEADPENVDARVKLGGLYLINGNVDEAATELDAALAQDPTNREARVLSASILSRLGDRDGALEKVQEVLAEEPGNIPAVSLLASMYAETDPDGALEVLDEGIAAAEESAALRLLRLGLLERSSRFEEMEEGYKDLIALYPDQKALRYSFAKFYANRDRVDDAQRVLVELTRAHPDDVTAKLQYAQFLANQRDAETAEAALKTYIAEEPEVGEFSFALAKLYESTSRRGEALGIYEAVIERDGVGQEGLLARNKIAALNLLDRDRDSARALIDEVLQADTSNTDALLMRARMAFGDGDTSSAIADLRAVLRNDPMSEQAMLLLGQAHLQANDRTLALENFRKLVAAHPGNKDGRLALARLMVQEQNWEEAERLLAGVIENSQGGMMARRMLVDVHIRQGRWDDAHARAREVLDMEGNEAIGNYLEGRIYQASGSLDEAIEYYSASIEAQSGAVESLSGLIGSYVAAGKAGEAREYLRVYNREYTKNVHSQTLLGQVNSGLGDHDLARAAFEQALQINEKWLPAYRELAGSYMRTGEMDEAMAVTRRGLTALPGNPELTVLLAGLHERKAEFPEAIALYEEALERNPGLDVAANNLAALISDHQVDPGRLQTALELVRRFEGTQNPLFLDTLGWVYYRLGDTERAVSILEQAVAGAGQVPQLRYHLGMAYLEAGRREEAKRELQAAVENSGSEFVGLDEARAALAGL